MDLSKTKIRIRVRRLYILKAKRLFTHPVGFVNTYNKAENVSKKIRHLIEEEV